MKQVILNENKLNGLTVYETAPIGSLLAFLGSSAPAGWLLCNQEYELKQSDYPDLYAMVKDFTACQSETTGYFKIPNLSGLVLQGESGNLGEILNAGLPNITGKAWNEGTSQGFLTKSQGAFNITRNHVGTTGGSTGDYGYYNELNFDASKSNEIYGNSDTVQPPAFTVNYILKATNYVSLPTNAIDDTKATTGNCWSASKVKEKLSYSTEEKVVGEWIDGKPIYRKAILANSAWQGTVGVDWKYLKTFVDSSEIPSIDEFISIGAYCYYSNSLRKNFPNGIFLTSIDTSGAVQFYNNISWGIGTPTKSYFVIEYTKTTD